MMEERSARRRALLRLRFVRMVAALQQTHVCANDDNRYYGCGTHSVAYGGSYLREPQTGILNTGATVFVSRLAYQQGGGFASGGARQLRYDPGFHAASLTSAVGFNITKKKRYSA
jgi:hypothetical protein